MNGSVSIEKSPMWVMYLFAFLFILGVDTNIHIKPHQITLNKAALYRGCRQDKQL